LDSGLQFLPTHYWRNQMANRNQDYYSGSRRSQQSWRDDDEREGNEAEAGTRGGNYDQGRVQYGRQSEEQSGSSGRYSGYGDFGRGDYGGGRSGWSDQGRSGYGQGDYGQSNSPEGYYGQGNYGQGYRAGGY